MAFKPNGISLKTNGDYFVSNGKAASKFVVNGVTVWEKVSVKNAPPFKSAGWTIFYKNQWQSEFPVEPGYDHLGWISEDRINAYNTLDEHTSRETVVFSSPIIETAAFTYFTTDAGSEDDPDTSEGSAWSEFYRAVRFSNDQIHWTAWNEGYYADKNYKYARVGMAWDMHSDSAVTMWYKAWINSVTFYQ